MKRSNKLISNMLSSRDRCPWCLKDGPITTSLSRRHVQQLLTTSAGFRSISPVIVPGNSANVCQGSCGTRDRSDLPKDLDWERRWKQPKETLRTIAHHGGEGTM